MNYLEYRSNALSAVAMLKPKDNFPPKHWSKDELENWVKREYERHHPKAMNVTKQIEQAGITLCSALIEYVHEAINEEAMDCYRDTFPDDILAIKVEEDKACDRVGDCMFMMFGYATCKCTEGYLPGRTLKDLMEV